MGSRGRKRHPASTATRSSPALGFEAQLRSAPNAVRGSMDAAEPKHVVLGLIFLKYIFAAFEVHRDILGRVYGYFPGQFVSAEGKKAGQFYRPRCVVKLQGARPCSDRDGIQGWLMPWGNQECLP